MIKNKIKNAAALLLGVSFVAAGAGCNFFPTNTEKDMEQEVANVNIANYVAETEFADYKDDIETIITKGGITTTIHKRDLVTAFLNVGSTYVESYGYTYRQTFELLMDTLVSRKIMVQYSMVYYLANEEAAKSVEGWETFKEQEIQGLSDKEKALLEAHPEVLTMKYFLADEDGNENYNKAYYSLKKALNDSLDSVEKEQYISVEEENHDHGEARTLPTGVDTEKTDYYPVKDDGSIDYDVYTGRNHPDNCGEYETIDGSTQTTRMKAYNTFLASLSSNNLILKGENTSNLVELDYFYVELASQLEQALIEKFSDDLTEAAEKELTLELVQKQYNLDVEKQAESYQSISAFETALDSVSDTSFVMSAPEENYGFVYNILLPFSAWQSEQYTAEKTKGYTESQLYAKRAELLNGIVGKDLRGSWISDHDHANYSYKGEDGKYYFFENQTGANANLNKYEALKLYAGNYAYNGTFEDGKAKPNTVANIDDFMTIWETELEKTGLKADGAKNTAGDAATNLKAYVTDGNYTLNDKDEFDYSEFVYYTGKVTTDGTTPLAYDPAKHFVSTTDAYKALSVFNELTFAYSTDPGSLSTYMGYVVSPFDTSFVNEFEYAAQYAIKYLGVGGYVVCPSDYGWHVIYVSSVLPAGNVYGTADKITQADLDNDEDDTFFDFYFASLKSASAQNYQAIVENEVLVEYNNGSCVKLYEDRYEDLLSIGE